MNEQQIVPYIRKEIEIALSSLGISSIKQEKTNTNKRFDFLIKTKENKTILVAVKSSGEPSYIYKAITQLKYYRSEQYDYLLVAAPSISEKSKNICKQSGVGFIDLKGNVFIKYGDVLIEKSEDKTLPKELRTKKRRVKNVFSGNALRVIITFLNNPKKAFTQDELSEKLQLSKGYVNRILKTLENGIKEEGEPLFLETVNDKKKGLLRKTKQYKINNPSKLLDILCDKYDFKENKIISFYSFERDTNTLMDDIATKAINNKLDYAFTLHAGASLSAPFVRFDDVYFYVKEEDINKWTEAMNLKKTEFGGNVFLVIPKYDWVLDETNTIKSKKTVNDVLLYLDLINYPKRGKEQAEFLREKKIGY